jgi:tRNA U55 pseudouridine synthase TruB
VEDVTRYVEKGETEHILLPMEILLPQFPKVILKERGMALAKNGNIIFAEDILRIFPQETWFLDPSQEQTFRLFSQEGKLLAFGRRVSLQGGIHPFLVVDS